MTSWRGYHIAFSLSCASYMYMSRHITFHDSSFVGPCSCVIGYGCMGIGRISRIPPVDIP